MISLFSSLPNLTKTTLGIGASLYVSLVGSVSSHTANILALNGCDIRSPICQNQMTTVKSGEIDMLYAKIKKLNIIDTLHMPTPHYRYASDRTHYIEQRTLYAMYATEIRDLCATQYPQYIPTPTGYVPYMQYGYNQTDKTQIAYIAHLGNHICRIAGYDFREKRFLTIGIRG